MENKNYFHPDNYSENHWHIYCDLKEGYFESIALQRKIDKSWDVFFQNFLSETELHILREKTDFYDDDFGVFLFNSPEMEVKNNFQTWVNNVLLPIRM